MKKYFTLCLTFILFGMLPASADGLKNSLTGLMNTKDKRSTVNLGQINLNGKSRQKQGFGKKRSGKTIIATVEGYKIRKSEADAYLKKATKGKIGDYDRLPKKQRQMVIKDLVKLNKMKNFKSRPSDTVIATVNGVDIIKKEADSYLSQVTGNKAQDYDRLDKKQRELLVEDLARPFLINDAMNKDISEEEKDALFKQIWIEKQMATVTVDNKEMLDFYEQTKQRALAKNPQAQIPSYMSMGAQIKNQIIEQKIIGTLMKDLKIEIYEDSNVTLDASDTNQTKKEQ